MVKRFAIKPPEDISMQNKIKHERLFNLLKDLLSDHNLIYNDNCK